MGMRYPGGSQGEPPVQFPLFLLFLRFPHFHRHLRKFNDSFIVSFLYLMYNEKSKTCRKMGCL